MPGLLLGHSVYDGSLCGQEMNRVSTPLPLGDHVWDEGTVIQPPTCSDFGVRSYACTVCGEVRDMGHDWEWISEGNYTRIRRCKICGARDESLKVTFEEMERKRTETYQNMDEGIY